MTKPKLPLDLWTFREIREEGWYYVDKTACARRLVLVYLPIFRA